MNEIQITGKLFLIILAITWVILSARVLYIKRRTQKDLDRLWDRNKEEASKALDDQMVYGTGFLKGTEKGIKHIPLEDVHKDIKK